MNSVNSNRLDDDAIGSAVDRGRMLRWFVWSAGVLFVITGLAKAFSATGSARALDVTDPIIGIPFRHLMLAVGLLELFIAFFCPFTDKRQFSLLAVVWLATNFVIYRLGLWWMGWHRPCGCLGNLTDLLRISPRAADNIMKSVLAYLLVGSYWLLWRSRRRSRVAAPLELQTGAYGNGDNR